MFSRRFSCSRERGSSDAGLILGLAGLAIAFTVVILIMGWIKEVKESRMVRKESDIDRPITSPYHTPGSFQVTCYPILRYTSLAKDFGC